MKKGIGAKLMFFLGASVLATVGALASSSYLLKVSSASSSRLNAATRQQAQASLNLVEEAAGLQDLTLQVVREQDPDAIETILARREEALQRTQALVAVAGQGAALMRDALADLTAANEKVKDAVLMAQGAQANQIFVEESNPAFETLLQEIKDFQDGALADLDREAVTEGARVRRLELAVWAVVGGVVLLVCGFGVLLIRSISRALRRVVDRVRDVAQGEGDLTKRLAVTSDDELGELAQWFNAFLEKLQQILTQVAGNTGRLAAASEQFSVTATEQTRSADDQRDQTQQVAAAMEEMAATVMEVSNNSNRAAQASTQAAETARRGGEVVEEALTQMRLLADSVEQTATQVQALGKSSERVGEIIGVIDDIADQTNLLALNAAIEAARAGEHGRGFAVVADEVRKLAEKTVKATKEIADMITRIQRETHNAVGAMHQGTELAAEGVQSTTQAGAALQEIIQMSEQVGGMIAQIATATTQQATSTEQVNLNVDKIASVTAGAAAASEQSAKSAVDLSELARDLQELVGQFKLVDEGRAHG